MFPSRALLLGLLLLFCLSLAAQEPQLDRSRGRQVILIVLGVPGVPAYVVSVAIGIGVLVYVGAGPRH